MSNETQAPFGTIRSFLWPIYRHEVKKIVPMIFILFFICFNYSIVRNMKDSMVVTASGAEVIPFIKLWVMLPSAVLLTTLYSLLCNRFSQENVFYMIVTAFLGGFALFAWVLYPMRDALMPQESAEWLAAHLPNGLGGLVSMYKNWTLTAFYVISELWGSMVLSVLFWGFANEVTKLSEASRFYSVFPMWLNVSTIFASQVSNWVTRGNMQLSKGAVWDATLPILVTFLIVSGILSMLAFWWTNRTILKGKEYEALHTAVKESKKPNKKSMSFWESFSYVMNSKYLLCIATIVIAYNLSINLVEIVWKDQLRNLYPQAADYNMFMNNLMTITAILSSVMAILIAKIMGRWGWTKTALITPVVIFVTSAGFFFFTFFNQNLGDAFLATLGASPLAIAVMFGAAQNALTKASKYSVFDATKEMAYIPLPHESKLKGKAAIDGVGSRLGKSGGSLIHQSLLMIFVTVSQAAPVVSVILFASVIFWFYAVKELGYHFKEISDAKEATSQ
ncbi:MAG: NTP/NDP exchange transporter [Chlamydiia bacterium]|nr:NTP/NDP exchange transporter [Chlamydiia bacterium]